MKTCKNCILLLEDFFFFVDTSKKSKLSTYCRNCHKIRAKANYLKNKKIHNEKTKLYYEKNKEYLLLKQREYLAKSEHQEAAKKHKRDYYDRNMEQAKQRTKQWRKDNQEKYIADQRKRYEFNKKQHCIQTSEYKKKNSAKVAAWNAKRRAQKLKATPSWLTKEHFKEIEKFYITCRQISQEMGIEYNVDHIVPLQGVNVCGLHVPWNLQVITQEENFRKHNKS